MTRIRPRSTGRKGWDRLVPEARDRQMRQARQAGRRVVAAVTAISPNYSGAFRERWLAQPLGPSVEQPIEGGFVPLLRANAAPETGYSIRNESPYAAEAMDLQPGEWFKPEFPEEPQGKIVSEGKRYGPFRGQVKNGEGNAISTAERDWYTSYAEGGQFAKDVKVGAQSAVVRRAR